MPTHRPPARLSALAARALPALPALAGALLLAAPPLAAQSRPRQAWASPRAQVSQVIGLSTVSLDYGRPAVKGRTIFGGLEAWGEVWRAGANENTTVTFSDGVSVEGHPLAAGTYGVHMIPNPDRFTVIFNRNAHGWGSYAYDAAEDALRVDVTPATGPHQEWLAWEFTDLAAGHATLQLRWGETVVPVRLEVDTQAVTLAYLKGDYLRGVDQFFWQGWNNAANWCLQNGYALDQGWAWAQRSTALGANFTNLWTASRLAEALGKAGEVESLRARAMAAATEPELNAAGYQLLQAGRLDEAVALFRANAGNHPGSWNAWDSLAEALAAKGDTAGAVQHYRKALELADDETQKVRIRGELDRLGAD